MSPDVAPGMEQSSALRVAIIGGGIGGLAAAVCLHRAGMSTGWLPWVHQRTHASSKLMPPANSA